MLVAARLGSLAAVIAPSNDRRMLSRLARCLCQGWEPRGMQGWPGKKKSKVQKKCSEERGMCLLKPCTWPCCHGVVFSFERIIPAKRSLGSVITSQTCCGCPRAGE